MTYEMRYCAFVDILAFKNLIADLDKGKVDVRTMQHIFFTVQTRPFLRASREKPVDLKVQTISDAICVSSKVEGPSLQWLLFSLSSLTYGLLEQGYFVRGAVVKGNLYHDDHVVFGNALIRAYELESTVARYPRIMLTKEVAEDIKKYQGEDPQYGDSVRQADDGPFFLHSLAMINANLDARETDEDRETQSGHFNILWQRLQHRFDESVDSPKHFEKVKWFARYWNESTSKYRRFVNPVTGPGMNAFD